MIESVYIVNPGDISMPRGGESRVIAFANSLNNNGFDVHLIVPKPVNEIPEKLQNISIHTVPVYSRGGNIKNQFFKALYLSKKARRMVNQNNAALQLEHSPFAGFAAFVGCSKFVLDMHDLAWLDPTYSKYIGIRDLIGLFEKKGLLESSAIITVSEPMRRIILGSIYKHSGSVYVIQNGYFKEKFDKLDLENVVEQEKTVCFLGTLHRKIDIYKIIYLAKSIDGIKIYVVGDGPARPHLQSMVKKYGLGGKISVLGWLPDSTAYRFLAESQVAVYPCKKSLHTVVSAPVRILDYAAMRKASVLDDISNCEVWKEFKQKKAAMFSKPDDPSSFVKCVEVLIDDYKLRRRMSHIAEKIAQKYTWDAMGDKLVKLYSSGVLG